jgi:hypothetical protein
VNPPAAQSPAKAKSNGSVPTRPGAAEPPERARPNPVWTQLALAGIRPKLAVGAPDDPLEREADQVAEALARPPAKAGVRVTPVTDRALRRVGTGDAVGGVADGGPLEERIRSPHGGTPLPPGLRADMEAGLGADLSPVRVHDSGADQQTAADLNARAFTHGAHIWLGSGSSVADRRLMAHELTHVVQQGGVARTDGEAVDDPERTRPANDLLQRSPTQDQAADQPTQTQDHPGQRHPAPARSAPAAGRDPDPGPDQATKGAAEPALPFATAITLSPEPQGDDTQGQGLTAPEPLPEADPGDHAAAASAGTADDTEPGGSADGEDQALPDQAAPDTEPAATADLGPPAGGPAGSTQRGSGPPTLVQREADGSPGLLERAGGFVRGLGARVVDAGTDLVAGARERIHGLVAGLSAGWTGLTSQAQAAFASLRAGFGGFMNGLSRTARGVAAAVQGGWTALSQVTRRLTSGLTGRLTGVVGTVFGSARAVAAAIARLDAEGARAAWQRLIGSIGGVDRWLRAAAQGIAARLAGLWRRLGERFASLSARLAGQARGLFNRLQSAAAGLRNRLASAWDALQRRASGLSTLVAGLPGPIRSLLATLASWGQGIWNGIRQGWLRLSETIGTVVAAIRQRLSALWQRVQQQAAAWWGRIRRLWGDLQRWSQRLVQRLTDGVRSIWGRLRNLSIATLLRGLAALAQVIHFGRRIVDGLREFLSPIAAAATNRVYAAMPNRALGYVGEQIERLGGARAVVGPLPAAGVAGTAAPVIQRLPRDTVGWADIKTGVWGALKGIWERLSWSSVFSMVLDALLEQVVPVVAIYRQGRDFVTQDIPMIIAGLFRPRNLLTHPLDALHDIYSNILNLFNNFLLAVLRRIVNILMAFMLWITIILTVIGLVGGSVAVGILAGVLGGLATLGIGAGPAAAAGAGAGGAAGAGVGFGVAALVNEAIFFAFLAVNGATILALLLGLATARQTDEERRHQYAQVAESGIAVGVGLALLALAWLAGVVAKGVAALLRRLRLVPPIALPPRLSRFLRGAGSVRKPRPGAEPVESVAERLVAEQRLAPQVGGALAARLVAELGPRAALELVEHLGANNVRRLGAELGPRAIQTIGRSLEAALVERLLDAGLRPSAIDTAVSAGQSARLAALRTPQAVALASLSEGGFRRIIGLAEPQYQRFIALGPEQLRTFAGMDRGAFERFAALSDTSFERFRPLSADKLRALAGVSDQAFNRYAVLAPADFTKFEALGAAALERFAGLGDAAFNRFAALAPAELQKFATLPGTALERFGVMDQARFDVFAREAQPATIARFAALSDAAFNRYAAIRYTGAELNKLGLVDVGALQNLATVTSDGHLTFLTKRLDATTLGNLGGLSGPEIDGLVTRVGTDPQRLTTLGSLSAGEVRGFLAIADDPLLQRFAGLPAGEIAAFRGLATPELERFAQVAGGDLRKFGRLDPAAVRRLASLSPDRLARFGTLTEAQLAVWGGVPPGTLARFAAEDALTLGKLADGAGSAGLNRLALLPGRFVAEFALLEVAAMDRYLRLPGARLAKFEGMTAFNMQQLANRPPGELERLAATRSPAELLADAGDTAADRAANAARVAALDDPARNPHTGRPLGHASEHSAAMARSPAPGVMSPVERRLRTGAVPAAGGGVIIGPRPPEVSVFASDAAQLEAVRLGRAQLQTEIAAGRAIGPGPGGRHSFATADGTAPALSGAGYSYRIEGGTLDAHGNLTGGTLVRRQVAGFRIIFDPTTAHPGTPADYRVVTTFPE